MKSSIARAASLALLCALAAPTAARAADEKAACVSAYEHSQVSRRERKWKRAREELRVCSRAVCPSLVRNDCVSWLDQVQVAYPSIVIHAELDGADLASARVFEDGELLASRLDGSAVELEPGEHFFRFETEGAPPVTMTLVVHEGEKNRVVPVNFVSPRAAADGAAGHSDDRTTSRPVPVGTYVLGGVGLAGLAVFGILGASGSSSESHLRSTCAPYCAKSDIDGVRGTYLAADVSLGVGVAALAGAALWYLARPTVDTTAPAATGNQLTVSPTRTGMVVGWSRAF